MNTTHTILQSIKDFLKSISESSLIYSPEAFTKCPYSVFCITPQYDVKYQNDLSLKVYGESKNIRGLIEKITFEKPLTEKGLTTGRVYRNSIPKEWVVAYIRDQWILIVMVPGKMDIDRFKTWKNFMDQPLYGSAQLIQKIQEVKLNFCRVQQRLEVFKRSTDLQIQYQQYLMEEKHVL